MTNILKYEERADVEKCKYILSLSDDILISEMYDPVEINQDGFIQKKETYIKQLRKWCRSMIKNKGKLTQKYKYSNRLKTIGRKYVRGFGVQSLQGKLRGFLIGDYYKDIDMKNMHPTILKFICKKYLDYENECLDNYIKCREVLLKKHNITKKQVLVVMNSDKSVNSSNPYLLMIDKQFKIIQKKLWEKEGLYEPFKDPNKKNKKGSFLNTLCCIYEDKILTEVKQKLKVDYSVPMFDGFLIDNDLWEDSLIFKLNKYTKNYGIQWTEKEHNKDIVICPELIDSDLNESSCPGYEQTKILFEEQHFLVEQPLIFVKEDKSNYCLYNKHDFITLVADFKYWEYCEKKGEMLEKPFYDKWIKDTTRRKYSKIDFLPKIDNNENIYNSFKGFENIPGNEFEPINIDLFLDHVNLLSNNESNVNNFLLDYLAHLIQKPYEIPETAILMKSRQGAGKDTLIDFIEKIIGVKYTKRTEKLDELFGQFNDSLKNKLIVQIDEIGGKDGFVNKESIKRLITTKRLNINEKGVKMYENNNYARVFIFTNNINPIAIPSDDRRFVVLKCGNVQTRDYYDKIYSPECMFNDDYIKSIHHYLLNRDISGFNPRNKRPITDAYIDMQLMQQPPIYSFLSKILNNTDSLDEYFDNYLVHKKTSSIFIKPADFKVGFTSYLNTENKLYCSHDYKTIKALLLDIGILCKVKNVKKIPSQYYVINIEKITDTLKNMGIKAEEIEDLDLDEFEVFTNADTDILD